MIAELELNFVNHAVGGGGDKYNVEDGFDIWVPQILSRKGSSPMKTMHLQIHSTSSKSSIHCKLEKGASTFSGSDRYQGHVGRDKFTVYVPQPYSRLNGIPRDSLDFIFTTELRPISWSDILECDDGLSCDLGKGSYGKVFRVIWKHSDNHEIVAIKVIKRDAGEKARGEALIAVQAEQELKCLLDSDRDCIVKVHGVVSGKPSKSLQTLLKSSDDDIQLDACTAIVMRYEEGGALKNIAKLDANSETPSLNLRRKLEVAADIAQAVADIHEIGLVHGDLKPDNVLLSNLKDPMIRLADFGMSEFRPQWKGDRDIGKSICIVKLDKVPGSPIYLAPEVLTALFENNVGCRSTRSSDMYAFGMLLYQLLAEKVPFKDSSTIAPEHSIETVEDLNKFVRAGNRPILDILTDAPAVVKTIIEECWKPVQPAPRDGISVAGRMSAKVCCERLRDVIRELDPLPPQPGPTDTPGVTSIGCNSFAGFSYVTSKVGGSAESSITSISTTTDSVSAAGTASATAATGAVNIAGTASTAASYDWIPTPPYQAEHEIRIYGKRGKQLPIPEGFMALDVTSTAGGPTKKLSSFHPYTTADGLPAFAVPGIDGRRSYTVEGVWQGLKVFENEGIDEGKFDVQNMKCLKRPPRGKRGRVLGHFNGEGQPLLGYAEARKIIYMPAYTELMDIYAPDALEDLYQLHLQQGLVLKDYFTNEDMHDLQKPLSHAAIVKKRLQAMFRERQTGDDSVGLPSPSMATSFTSSSSSYSSSSSSSSSFASSAPSSLAKVPSSSKRKQPDQNSSKVSQVKFKMPRVTSDK